MSVLTGVLPDGANRGSGDPGRWFGVGRSEDPDAGRAGAEAAAQAFAGRVPTLALVFCAHTFDLAALLAPMQMLLGENSILAGCTTNGQFGSSAPVTQDVEAGVVVIGIGGPGIEATASLIQDVSARRREAGEEASAVVDLLDSPNRVCLLIADGLTREQHAIVRGSYAHLGAATPTVGGCAGDDIRYVRTFQFLAGHDHHQIVSDGLVGVGLGSLTPMGIGVGHGWSKAGTPFLVTSSSEGRVYELDNRPALDVYLESLGLDRSFAADLDAFRALAFTHPLGLSRRTGEDIRVVHDAQLSDGSLLCLADVPQGAIAWQMGTDPDSLIAAATDSVDQALAGLGDAAPLGVVAFDCGARKVMLGQEGVMRELTALAGHEGVPVGGFYTFGEIARVHGARGMHHLTVVTLAFS